MPSRVQLKLSAAEDLAGAYAWYETQRIGLGDEFLQAVGQCLDTIVQHPRGNAIATKDTRRALVKRFPYSVFYRLAGQEIIVRAIFHHSRDPSRWRRRLRDERE
jgi:plasmid stabilization system protein ParE